MNTVPKVDGLHNLRDIGGLPTTDGRRTRAGVLLRAEAPVLVGEAAADFASLGLRTMFDLRSAEECERVAVFVPSTARRIPINIAEPIDEHGRNLSAQALGGFLTDFDATHLGQVMVDILDEQPETLGQVIRELVLPDATPALVHCTAGKDRTGLVIAAMLDAVGVTREAILADYERSTQGRAHRRPIVGPKLKAVGIEVERVIGLFSAPPEVLVLVFEHLDRRYGGARRFLLERAGVDEADLDLLDALLLED